MEAKEQAKHKDHLHSENKRMLTREVNAGVRELVTEHQNTSVDDNAID